MKRVALFVIPLVLAGLAAGPPTQSSSADVELKEWTVPWERSRPRDPYVDGQGRVWFVGQRSDYVAYLDPETGEFERYDLEPGTGPHNLIVDGDGMVWYAGNGAAHIGVLDPADGSIEKIAMPDPEARDPHTLVFNSEGDIWFTLQGANMVGRLDTDTRDVRLVAVPTPRSRPYGIVLDSDDRPWVAQFGTNKLGTVDPATMAYREIELPRADARPRRIGVTSDDMVWYVDYAQGYLGRLDPVTGAIQEWRAPSGAESRPYAMAVDDQDRIWFFETGIDPNRLVGFDPSSQGFFEIAEIGSGGGTVRHAYYHSPTGTIWFGTDTNTIGRARLP